MLTAALGIIAGLLQALGYFFYIYLTLKRGLRPNATTWFMFAYGTLLLTVLEFDRDAGWALLILPITCTVLGVLVAGICWYLGTLKWPDDWGDRTAFVMDVFLTFCYLSSWVLQERGALTQTQTRFAVAAFLVASNLTALTSFGPLLREAWREPEHERYEPWLVWSLAYTTLGIGTYLTVGLWSELMLYPLLNAPLHGAVAWLARPCRRRLSKEDQVLKAAPIS